MYEYMECKAGCTLISCVYSQHMVFSNGAGHMHMHMIVNLNERCKSETYLRLNGII